MADFKIKSTAGTGNKTLIQSQDQSGSSYAIQVGDAGATTLTNATLTNATLTAGAVTSSAVTGIDCVKLFHVDHSGAATLNINGHYDDSKYAYYEYFFSDMRGWGGYPIMRCLVSGTADTTSNYHWAINEFYHNQGSHGDQHRSGRDETSFAQIQGTWSYADDPSEIMQLKVWVSKPQGTTNSKLFTWNISGGNQPDDQYFATIGTGFFDKSTTAVTGISLYSSGSTNFSCSATLYGYKK